METCEANPVKATRETRDAGLAATTSPGWFLDSDIEAARGGLLVRCSRSTSTAQDPGLLLAITFRKKIRRCRAQRKHAACKELATAPSKRRLIAMWVKLNSLILLAEAVRFELTNRSPRRQFSRLVPSTARPRFLEGSGIMPHGTRLTEVGWQHRRQEPNP